MRDQIVELASDLMKKQIHANNSREIFFNKP